MSDQIGVYYAAQTQIPVFPHDWTPEQIMDWVENQQGPTVAVSGTEIETIPPGTLMYAPVNPIAGAGNYFVHLSVKIASEEGGHDREEPQ